MESITSEDLVDYFKELSPTYLPPDVILNSRTIDTDKLPNSYKVNDETEQKCLTYLETFKSQYKELLPTRKPLLLSPVNECNIPKFICSYICPTILPYPTLNEWSGIAEFVADHLNYQPLIPCTEIPKTVYSTNTVLALQEGNCLDYSILLCSLLIGVGYDAYIISGYASRECCYADETRSKCSYFEEKPVELPNTTKPKLAKYTVKPIKKLQSNYELERIAKRLNDKRINEDDKTLQLLKQKEAEKPKPDPLFALRVHMWVCIRSGLRGIKNDFFIEPFTGKRYDTKHPMFLGIESIFNHKNYWFNKFCCNEGCRQIKFNINNLKYWEPIFQDDINIFDPIKDQPKTALIPLTFIKNLRIEKEAFYKRYPNYQKCRRFNKVEEWNYSSFFCLSGLTKRYKLYEDFDCQKLLETHEILDKREDKHYKSIITCDKITQLFHPGSEYHLKEYVCDLDVLNGGARSSNYRLLFHQSLRSDGLLERMESNNVLEEIYLNRPDNLEYIKVEFIPRDPDDDFSRSYRFIECITKTYCRNPMKSAHEDIQEVKFYLNDNEIHVKFHLGEFCISNSSKKFKKPPPLSEHRNDIHVGASTIANFQVPSDLNNRQKSKLEIYEMLRDLMADEKKTVDGVRASEMETNNITLLRQKAQREDYLFTDLYDTIHNAHSREVRQHIDQIYKAQQLCIENNCNKEEEADFLQPYLYQLHMSSSDIRTHEQAFIIREICLEDLRNRLVVQANNIKLHLEAVTAQLHKLQMYYYQNKMIMNTEDEKSYLLKCAYAIETLEVLENLLARHKQHAPYRYIQLEHKLKMDIRLKHFLK